jgi:hypothetical protein
MGRDDVNLGALWILIRIRDLYVIHEEDENILDRIDPFTSIIAAQNSPNGLLRFVFD